MDNNEEWDDKEIITKIKAYLEEKKAKDIKTAVKPQEISKHIFAKSQKKYINPYLYQMKDNGEVTVKTNQRHGDPRWYLLY